MEVMRTVPRRIKKKSRKKIKTIRRKKTKTIRRKKTKTIRRKRSKRTIPRISPLLLLLLRHHQLLKNLNQKNQKHNLKMRRVKMKMIPQTIHQFHLHAAAVTVFAHLSAPKMRVAADASQLSAVLSLLVFSHGYLPLFCGSGISSNS
jgi:hypothetical protein